MLYIPTPSNKQTVALICDVVGDARRAENWSDRSLAVACGGPLVAHLDIRVTFFFLLALPPVIVDMEPAPAMSKFHCEAKRAWAHARGIVYVPIFLRDKLTRTQFQERLKVERAALDTAKREASQVRARRKVATPRRTRPEGYTIHDPEIQALITEETFIRIEVEEKAGIRLRGGARDQRLAKMRREVEAEFLARVRDGSVGHQLRDKQSALPAR